MLIWCSVVALRVHAAGIFAAIQGFVSVGHWAAGVQPPSPPQHRLYFVPEAQGHGSFRPTLRPTTQSSSPVEGVKGVESRGQQYGENERQRKKLRDGE